MADALEAAIDRVIDTIRELNRRQREDSDPTHEDFYAWGYGLSEMTAQLEQLVNVLRRQIAGYGDRFILRDDEGADPAERLGDVEASLMSLMQSLTASNRYAREYHS